jgi:hypothetical protein
LSRRVCVGCGGGSIVVRPLEDGCRRCRRVRRLSMKFIADSAPRGRLAERCRH